MRLALISSLLLVAAAACSLDEVCERASDCPVAEVCTRGRCIGPTPSPTQHPSSSPTVPPAASSTPTPSTTPVEPPSPTPSATPPACPLTGCECVDVSTRGRGAVELSPGDDLVYGLDPGADLASGDLTVELALVPIGLADEARLLRLEDAVAQSWLDLVIDDAGRVRLELRGAATEPLTLLAPDPLRVGVWAHVAALVDRDGGRAELLIDGVSVAARELGPDFFPVAPPPLVRLGLGVETGRRVALRVDEVRVWRALRSREAIAEAFCEAGAGPDLALHAALDETSFDAATPAPLARAGRPVLVPVTSAPAPARIRVVHAAFANRDAFTLHIGDAGATFADVAGYAEGTGYRPLDAGVAVLRADFRVDEAARIEPYLFSPGRDFTVFIADAEPEGVQLQVFEDLTAELPTDGYRLRLVNLALGLGAVAVFALSPEDRPQPLLPETAFGDASDPATLPVAEAAIALDVDGTASSTEGSYIVPSPPGSSFTQLIVASNGESFVLLQHLPDGTVRPLEPGLPGSLSQVTLLTNIPTPPNLELLGSRSGVVDRLATNVRFGYENVAFGFPIGDVAYALNRVDGGEPVYAFTIDNATGLGLPEDWVIYRAGPDAEVRLLRAVSNQAPRDIFMLSLRIYHLDMDFGPVRVRDAVDGSVLVESLAIGEFADLELNKDIAPRLLVDPLEGRAGRETRRYELFAVPAQRRLDAVLVNDTFESVLWLPRNVTSERAYTVIEATPTQ